MLLFITGGILEDSYFDDVPGAGGRAYIYYSHINKSR